MPKLAKLMSSKRTGLAGSTITGQGRDSIVTMQFAPYGLISRAPSGALCITIPLNGDDSNSIVLADLINKAGLPDIAEGEAMLANYLSKAYLHLKNDGSALLKGKAGNFIHLRADGKIEIKGEIITPDDVISGGKSLQTHRHNGVQSGGGNTGSPI
jgi:phage gp45-like